MSVSAHQTGATCPSCGRFVGPIEKCPYCGAAIKKRIPIGYLRIACLILAVLGVAVLLYIARGTATPRARIGDIGATMNFAYVRLTGKVTRGPLYDPDAQSLRFYVADDTGEIQAGAFRQAVQELIAAGKIPAVGDTITMEGSLRVRDDFAMFNLAGADQLQLVPPTATEIKLNDIGHDDEYHFVTVRGEVRDIRQPYQGLTLITLGDAYGEADVAVNGDIEKLYGALTPVTLGDIVEVRGVVTYFRDSPQISLRHPRDFRKLDAENAAATTVRIGEIDAGRVNQRVRVEGQVTQLTKFSQGMRVVVRDNSGSITLVLWQEIADQIPNAGDLGIGADIQVVGRVSEYRGELEISPGRHDDIKIDAADPVTNATVPAPAAPSQNATVVVTALLSPTPELTPIAVRRTISALTAADKGALVTLNGTITRANSFSQGIRYTLDDTTGKIILLLWSDVLDKLPIRDQLKPGAQVRVTGKLDVFNDSLEIIPKTGDAVELTAPAQSSPSETRTIGSVTPADVGQNVRLKGTVADIADFSRGKYVTLRDDSGTIQITVFRNVLEPVQDKLAIGATANAQGTVNLYHGNLEIVADELVVE